MMDDPWDVKSVRRAGEYISCMKINGSPLLPPVLSKECYKEMQYYKLLAKEVEKRISILQPYIGSDETIADQEENSPPKEAALSNLKTIDNQSQETKLPTSDFFELSSPKVVTTTDSSKLVIDFSLSINQSGRNVLETVKRLPLPIEFPERDYTPSKEKELLTHVQTTGKQQDRIKTKVLQDIDSYRNATKNDFPIAESIEDQGDLLHKKVLQKVYKSSVKNNYAPFNTIPRHINKQKTKELDDIDRYRIVHEDLAQTHDDSSFSLGADVSFSTKSFTGSLNNLHTESMKDSDICNITRQRSYTVLNPSPQLLAHLEVQSLTTGVEVKSISMSESLSSIVTLTGKKRRSWDLESAKVKWSSMAQDLNNKNLPGCNARNMIKQAPKVTTQANHTPPHKAKTISLPDKNKRTTSSNCGAKAKDKRKPSPHRDYPSNTTVPSGPTSARSPLQKRQPHPRNYPLNTTGMLGTVSATSPPQKRQPHARSPPPRSPPTPRSPRSPPTTLPREADKPGNMVRELYEKIQRDQTAQMACLVEKQKMEQKRLQQVFEEQNNILLKQLKTIVPEGSIEAKRAWGDDSVEPERGPVSLSQLINNTNDHPISLIDTHNYISKCDTVLKKSRDISSTIKKPTAVTPNSNKSQSSKVSARSESKGRSPLRNMVSPTRKSFNTPTMSPAGRHVITSPQCQMPAQRRRSRRLDYDTSSEHELNVILTDRTNDTLADLNVTFPTDNSDATVSSCSPSPPLNDNELTILHSVSVTPKAIPEYSRDSVNGVDETSKQFLEGPCNSQPPPSPQPKQLAAATKIVAFAKGYLVRRLMRTERVTSTVQTIRDALLCALQLHQDREGIRGADVDLHRRLIQQITAACYSLHDTFIASSPAERCALIAADRARLLRPRPVSAQSHISRRTDVMSQSHSGVFPSRPRPASASLMTQSTYETPSSDKGPRPRHAPSPRRRPWR